MSRIALSIIHFFGFCLVVIMCVVLFAKNVIIGVDGWTAKTLSLFSFHHTGNLSCDYQDIASLNQANHFSLHPICTRLSCTISINDEQSHRLVSSFTTIDNTGAAVNDIHDVFFDPNRRIVSYALKVFDLSSRIVMNFDGELLQSIDETPGEARQLKLLGYQNQTGMLVYVDQKTNNYDFYAVDRIYLARRTCPSPQKLH